MKKLFFLLTVAAMCCFTTANAQFTRIAFQQNGNLYLWDSIKVSGVDRNGQTAFNWILILTNSFNGATELAAGDSIYVTFGLNGTDMISAAIGVTKTLGVDSTVLLTLPLRIPGNMFVEGDYANVLSSKVTGRYTNGTKTEFEDQYPFNGRFTVEFKGEIGINEANLENVRLYPNPVRNSLNIENANNLDVNIYAANGQLVKHVTANGNMVISVNDLSAGLYIVKMQNEKATRVEKIQVVR